MSETTKRFLRSSSVRSRGRGRGRGRMHKVRQPVTYVRDSAMQSPQQTIRTSSGREVVVIDDFQCDCTNDIFKFLQNKFQDTTTKPRFELDNPIRLVW